MEETLVFNAITCDFPGYHLKKQEQSVHLRKGGHQVGCVMGLELDRGHLPEIHHNTRSHLFLIP